MNIRVMLADDHKILREALRSVLEHEPDIAVVAEASDGNETLRLVEQDPPDVVVMDIGMPGMDGIEATRRLIQECPAIKVVALSTYFDRRIVLQMLEAGARGYVVKASGGKELVRAIRSAVQDQIYLCPEIASIMADSDLLEGKKSGQEGNDKNLGQREREVLQMLSAGKTSPEIAARLHIAATTVEAHRRNIMRKLNLRSVADLTRYAILQGLTPPSPAEGAS